MISLSSVKTLAANSLGRTGLILNKKSPEIMLGVGVVGIVVGTVLACRATLKVSEITTEAKEVLDKIKSVQEATSVHDEDGANKIDYTEADANRDTAIVYVQTAVKIGQLYLPAIAIMSVSVALIVGSHHILSKRNAAIAAAYKLVDESFRRYRERVKQEYGEEAEYKLHYGQQEVKVMEKNAKGKEVEVTKKVPDLVDINIPYTFTFEEKSTTLFCRSYDHNHTLLNAVERYANDRLQLRGHIFLNEVLDDLGLERTKEGAIVGWVKGYNKHNPSNDRYVSLGIEAPVNQEKEDPYEAMIQPWILNMNVDGNIYDLI